MGGEGVSREEVKRTARMLVEHCVALRPGEHVLVVGDTTTDEIADVLAEAAREGGGDVVLAIMEPRAQHGNDPPKVLAAAMLAADVMLMAVKHSITHTTARKEASARGARAVVLRSVTVESMTQGAATADYPAVRRLTKEIAQVLTRGKTVYVTSPEGTDLRLRIDGRSALALDGFSTEPGTFTPFPTGEAAIVPVEGSAEGVAVFDHAIDNVGTLDAPIRCEVRGGRIVRVDGGRSAEVFRTLIATDANAGNIAEFAIGTNPNSRLRGNMAEDKVLLGVVHIGVGDSHTIGGLIESQIHVDAIILNPTVEVDGARIVDRRTMLVEVR
ncbi:MAG TPA: aminopeptidase [bacterium]|nr:aminopeptidase [bacterium]